MTETDLIWGSAVHHARYMQPIKKGLWRKCHCGCNKFSKFSGMANGVCLMHGCELSTRRWVRDGVNARKPILK